VNLEADILENEILINYPKVLEILLLDRTSKKNIFWATDNYHALGVEYSFSSPILPELITGKNGNVIMPRIKKDKIMQQERSKNMAEVFTPSWLCNSQNNLVDKEWFQSVNDFNFEIINKDGSQTWKTNDKKIVFPENKTWENYVCENRLEIACGEGPYIVSRYDSTTGIFIPVRDRIGILDRKLRIVNENCETKEEWLIASEKAFKHTYAYEWQGDSLLLAREAMLYTFIENYSLKFGELPLIQPIENIAHIISWNVWQMDGIKCVIPNSCRFESIAQLFGDEVKTECIGCKTDNVKRHNGIYSQIKDWKKTNPESGEIGLTIRFIDLIKR
jgi:hypothetical protein